jgi:hypothetical protein
MFYLRDSETGTSLTEKMVLYGRESKRILKIRIWVKCCFTMQKEFMGAVYILEGGPILPCPTFVSLIYSNCYGEFYLFEPLQLTS